MTMRALVMTRYGGPDAMELREVPVPSPGPGEVRVKVSAAGLNPVDLKIREGQIKVLTSFSLPIVAGNELAGTVEALGEGTAGFAVGDEVFARVEKDRLGAFAEYACVRASSLAKKPRSLDLTTAAAVPLAALTALQALRDELHVASGQRVFIPGGAGGVGTFAIQLAKHLGASVATTASPRGRDLVARLGADVIVDYTTHDFATELHDYDSAFDLMGGDTLSRSFGVVRKGGRVVSVAGMPEPTTATKDLGRGAGLAALFWLASTPQRLRAWRHGVSYRFLFMHPSGAELSELAALIDDRKLEVVVDRVFPFADVTGALAYLEQGRAKGKVVVRMDDAGTGRSP